MPRNDVLDAGLPRPGLFLRASLWTAQAVLAVFYLGAGTLKTVLPLATLARFIPWTADYSVVFVRMTGVIDLAGGFGILLPSLLRLFPALTVWAAIGCSLLQMSAIVFHLVRSEFAILPVNLTALALSLFILWGRTLKVPVQPPAMAIDLDRMRP